jgi:hypothetical protein
MRLRVRYRLYSAGTPISNPLPIFSVGPPILNLIEIHLVFSEMNHENREIDGHTRR